MKTQVRLTPRSLGEKLIREEIAAEIFHIYSHVWRRLGRINHNRALPFVMRKIRHTSHIIDCAEHIRCMRDGEHGGRRGL